MPVLPEKRGEKCHLVAVSADRLRYASGESPVVRLNSFLKYDSDEYPHMLAISDVW